MPHIPHTWTWIPKKNQKTQIGSTFALLRGWISKGGKYKTKIYKPSFHNKTQGSTRLSACSGEGGESVSHTIYTCIYIFIFIHWYIYFDIYLYLYIIFPIVGTGWEIWKLKSNTMLRSMQKFNMKHNPVLCVSSRPDQRSKGPTAVRILRLWPWDKKRDELSPLAPQVGVAHPMGGTESDTPIRENRWTNQTELLCDSRCDLPLGMDGRVEFF